MDDLRALDIVLTSDCNLRCADRYQNAKRPGVMSWKTLRAAVDLLLGSTSRDVRAHFVGGEPLLAFDLIERAVRRVETSKPPALSVSFSLTTNGLLLGPREEEFLDAHGFRLRLSFDGVGPMQRLRGNGTHKRLDRLLDLLAANHPAMFQDRLAILVTLVPDAIHHLADTVRYLLGKGVRDVSLEPAILRAVTWSRQQHRALTAQFEEVFEASVAHYERTGQVPLRRFRRRADGTPARGSIEDWYCGVADGHSLTVDVDGSVTGCVMFARSYQDFPSTRLGANLADLGLGHIEASDLPQRLAGYRAKVEAAGIFNNRARKHSSFAQCLSCRSRSQCVVCPCAIVHAGVDDDPDRLPDFPCAFNRVAGHYQRRFRAAIHEPEWKCEYDRVLDLAKSVIARERARSPFVHARAVR